MLSCCSRDDPMIIRAVDMAGDHVTTPETVSPAVFSTGET